MNSTTVFDFDTKAEESMTTQIIKCGDKIITQDLFDKMYSHYSDLLIVQGATSFWKNEFYIADAERIQLKQQLSKIEEDLRVAFFGTLHMACTTVQLTETDFQNWLNNHRAND
jgi:hypothetical protein